MLQRQHFSGKTVLTHRRNTGTNTAVHFPRVLCTLLTAALLQTACIAQSTRQGSCSRASSPTAAPQHTQQIFFLTVDCEQTSHGPYFQEIFNKRLIDWINTWAHIHPNKEKWPTSTSISGPRKDCTVPAPLCCELSASTALLLLVGLNAFRGHSFEPRNKHHHPDFVTAEDVSPLPSPPLSPKKEIPHNLTFSSKDPLLSISHFVHYGLPDGSTHCKATASPEANQIHPKTSSYCLHGCHHLSLKAIAKGDSFSFSSEGYPPTFSEAQFCLKLTINSILQYEQTVSTAARPS